jgi:hypothetical protein
MTEDASGLIAVELTPDEARLVVAALRQFEPYWPSDMDDLSRVELLAGIHRGIEHVTEALGDPRSSS